MIEKTLKAEIERMNGAIEWAQTGLKRAPEGHLLIDTSSGEARYYVRKSTKERKGVYLGKADVQKRNSLAQKDYECSLLKAATKEKLLLEKALARFERNRNAEFSKAETDILAQVYDGLPETRKRLVEPYILSDEEFAKRWSQHEYEGNGHAFGIDGFYTRKGQQVRSKSEVIIADLLDAANVPYRYEQALYLESYSTVYPDFTVLNKRTRQEFIWEHLGAMENPEYCKSALRKLNQYAVAGYLPGDRLLITQESVDVPLDTRTVTALIERFLT